LDKWRREAFVFNSLLRGRQHGEPIAADAQTARRAVLPLAEESWQTFRRPSGG
jgi:hypothetical protein